MPTSRPVRIVGFVRPTRPLLAVIAAAAFVLTTAFAGPPARAAALPTDPNQVGFIALCGPSGQTITGGSVATGPFVWKAISSRAPQTALTGPGQNAVLDIYQERPGVEPGDWSGDQLTADTEYTTPQHPTTLATRKDVSLAVITAEYPPLGPGYYQLRMRYARMGVGVDPTGHYAATTIAVTGADWHVVAGGVLPCSAGTGRSSEVYAGSAPAAPTAAYVAEVTAAQKVATRLDPQASASLAAAPAAGGGAGTTSTTNNNSPAITATGSAMSPSSHSTAAATLGGVAVVVAAAAVSWWLIRRRRTTPLSR